MPSVPVSISNRIRSRNGPAAAASSWSTTSDPPPAGPPPTRPPPSGPPSWQAPRPRRRARTDRRPGPPHRDRRAATRIGAARVPPTPRTINRGHLDPAGASHRPAADRLGERAGQGPSAADLQPARSLPGLRAGGCGLAGRSTRPVAGRGVGARGLAGPGRQSNRCSAGGRSSSPPSRGPRIDSIRRDHPGFLDTVLAVIAEQGRARPGTSRRRWRRPAGRRRAGGSGRSPRPRASTCSWSAPSGWPTGADSSAVTT